MLFLTSLASRVRLRRSSRSGALLAPAVAVAVGALFISSAAQSAPTAGPANSPATAPAVAAAPVADQPLAPTQVLGMGDEMLKDADQMLAQRFSTAAFDALQQGNVSQYPEAWKQAVAYLKAASTLDPLQPHHVRMLWQAQEHLHDIPGVIETLEKYRKLVPDDEIAKLRLIELYADSSQTNEKRIAYLTRVLEMPTVSNEIKSRCATMAAASLMERSRSEAMAMVNRATELDPLNIYARRMEYHLFAKYQSGPLRLRSLLAQLKCNPAQVDVLAQVSRELAAAGLVREAARWFVVTTELSNRTRTPIDSTFFSDYAAQLYLNGQIQLADQELSKVIELDPGNIDAWFLRLTMRQASDQKFEYERELTMARQRLAGQAALLARQINKAMTVEAPATQPTTNPSTQPTTKPFDFSAGFSSGGTARTGAEGMSPADAAGPSDKILADTIAKLQRPDAPQDLKREFTEAISDLAWYEVYFNRSESAAITWIDALKKLLGEKSVTVHRVSGWLELLRHNDAEAMKLLWPIRFTDPLAGMGVVELLAARNWAPAPKSGAAVTTPAQRPKEYDPDELAQKLLNDNPSGLMGAMLTGGLRERKRYIQAGALADSLLTEMKQFNPELLAVVVAPEQFYFAVGREVNGPYALGRPILAEVTLQNTKRYDLPIGPDGIIKPDMWFDARFTLQTERRFPMCATDKITGALVLKAGQSITQTVRIDQGPLIAALRERPAGSINITMTVITNPMVLNDGSAAPGPGGVRKQFAEALHRGGLPINTPSERKRIFDMIAADSLPQSKAWAIEVMTAYVEEMTGPNPGERTKEFAPEFLEHVLRETADPVPQIGAIAALNLLRLPAQPIPGANGPKIDKVQMLQQVATSPLWEARLAAVAGARMLPPADATALAKSLLKDPVEVVRTAAAMEVGLASKREGGPTTRPAQ